MHVRIILALAMLAASQPGCTKVNYRTLDVTGASQTDISGISDGKFFGKYADQEGNAHWFLYNGEAFTTFDFLAMFPNLRFENIDLTDGSSGTFTGYFIDENQVSHGFINDHGTYTTFAHPSVGKTFAAYDTPNGKNTRIRDVAGHRVLGTFEDERQSIHGFLDDTDKYGHFPFGVAHAIIDHPLAGSKAGQGTFPVAISGGTIVGLYIDPLGKHHGFVATLEFSPLSYLLIAAVIALLAFAGFAAFRKSRRGRTSTPVG